MSTQNQIKSTAVLLGILIIAGQIMAHSGAMGIVKERMDGMSILGDHAKSVGNMLKGKTPFQIAVVQEAAQSFVTHGEQIPNLFPNTKESREGAETEALPVIWDNWENFTALATQFTEDSQKLLTLSGVLSTDSQSAEDQSRAVRAAFFRSSKSCSACHERFRLDQS
ncbi:MAG: cytochrome c556 [Granulosicoccus sp.]|jgi:cytochrome c556